jgi:two-component system, sensor histidine kinase YesM
LNVKLLEDNIMIEVIDNGMGMDSNCIDSILCLDEESSIKKRHVTGIGISNVLHRLQLLFNIEDSKELISIYSEIGSGTKVTLRLPSNNNVSGKGVDIDDKAINCG